MKNILRVLSVSLVLILQFGIFYACSDEAAEGRRVQAEQRSQDKVTISICYNWTGQDSKAPVWESRLTEFQEIYKGKVELDMIPVSGGGSGIRTKVQTDFAANNASDFMVFYDGKEILPYIKRNYLADLTDIIRNDSELSDRFIEGAMETATFKERIYGVPLVQGALVFFANNRLFRKHALDYPVTNEDFIKCIRVFRQNNLIPVALGNRFNEKSVLLYSAFSQRVLKPGDFMKASYSEEGITFLDEGFVRTAGYLMDWTRLGAFPDGVNVIEKFSAIDMFNNEKAAMLFEGSWVAGSIKKELLSQVDLIRMPVFPETLESKSLCGFSEMNLIVNRRVADDPLKKPYIPVFIKFVTDPAFVKHFAEVSGSVIPSVKGVELDSSKTNPLLVKATELFNKAEVRGPRLFSYMTPGQMVALRDGVSNMLNLNGTPVSNMKPLADKTKEENGK